MPPPSLDFFRRVQLFLSGGIRSSSLERSPNVFKDIISGRFEQLSTPLDHPCQSELPEDKKTSNTDMMSGWEPRDLVRSSNPWRTFRGTTRSLTRVSKLSRCQQRRIPTNVTGSSVTGSSRSLRELNKLSEHNVCSRLQEDNHNTIQQSISVFLIYQIH